jgi:transposase
MKTNTEWAPGPEVRISQIERMDDGWTVSATVRDSGRCPACDAKSGRRHGLYVRHLQDLPSQGAVVRLRLELARWRCVNLDCARQTFGDRLPAVAQPYARRTDRVAELARLVTHTAGGRPARRLMARLGMPQSKDTLLRALKRGVRNKADVAPVRVVGIDDWSWRKGTSYGTIMVDVERREVLDILQDRSAESTSNWLRSHPSVEFVSRDRCGLYAQGAAQGAPQAQQVADRFHLLQNLRHAIEQQLSRAEPPCLQVEPDGTVGLPEPPGLIHRYGPPEVTEHRQLVETGRRDRSRAGFDRVKSQQAEGRSLADIVRETGFHWRTVRKWTRQEFLRPRATMAPKPSTPSGFSAYLARRWNEGCTMGKQLLAEIRPLGYTGSLTHLQRLLNGWRRAHFAAAIGIPTPQAAATLQAPAAPTVPPIVAAALCIKPRGLLTEAQAAKVDQLKERSSDFATMRQLAMRFRGLLKGSDPAPLDGWLSDAASSGIHGMRRFAVTLRRDLPAVRNAISEPWSNGQTEGQINRLKMLKRSMYGRAGVELLRARMLPYVPCSDHTV